MQHQPAILDRALEAGLVFRRGGALDIEHRIIQLLNVNAAVLDRLDGIGKLDDLARGDLGIGVAAGLSKLHALENLLSAASW
jgi:hypothetical protein